MKLATSDFGDALNQHGFNFYSGVPCSFLADLINYAINEANYVMSNNETDAVAIASGAYLAGKKSVVLMQNSGLSNAISALSSLNHTFQLPVLGFVSLRGASDISDEPQHELMGRITEKMLDLLEIPWEYLSTEIALAKQQLIRADEAMSQNRSFFFVVKKGTFDKVELKAQTLTSTPNLKLVNKQKMNELPKRLDVLSLLTQNFRDCALLATTGKTGRELYECHDSAANFYMVGSMGCISSIALGLAINQPTKSIIAIDGDGALLMRLGNLATNGYYSANNLLHLVIDNNCHDSTGGQFTVSHNVNFVEIAAACGYANSIYCHSLDELNSAIGNWNAEPKSTLLYIKVSPGSKNNLGRPKVSPPEVKDRFMAFLRQSNDA